MLNLGVAIWWLLRPEPLPPAPWTPPAGVPRLQLLGEAPQAAAGLRPVDPAGAEAEGAGDGGASNASGAGPAPDPVAAEPARPSGGPQCYSFGPFASAAAAEAARTVLRTQGATRLRLRNESQAPRPQRWSVAIAPQPDRAAADALAARIRAAGFSDLQVLSSGDDANGLALGVFSSEAAARRRESALNDAGFDARAHLLDAAGARHWLDVAAGAGFDAASARGAAGAGQVRDADCAGIVGEGTAG